MAADFKNEEGQSVLEFLLMLPMMVALVVILVRINTVIQISIVNQQYSRAQALSLSYNSSVYPLLRLRNPELTDKGYNQMILGVSSNKAERGYHPEAATHYIARKKGEPSGEDKKEPKTRALVRVRNSVTLCTQPNVVSGSGGGNVPIMKLADLSGGQGLAFAAAGPSMLGENAKFDYCGGPPSLKYDLDGGDGEQ
jgi:hypothetical protein